MIIKVSVFILVIIAFFLGRYFESMVGEAESVEMERMYISGSLVNPLLECEVNTYGSTQKYLPFEDDIKNRIDAEIISKNKDILVSLYFRNLRNGPWFGINEEAEFSPASLMKLPIAMAYMKWSEIRPGLLDMSISGSLEDGATQNIIPENTVENGKSYTVNELIRLALVYSDNNANHTLLSNIPKDILFQVFRDLNIPIIDEIEQGKNDYITVKEYASFFRILYNASYLTRDTSHHLLDIMSHSTQVPGLSTRLPTSTTIAHKFGERRIQDPSGKFIRQYHDCGIVYHETYPYLLCVMTKGGDDMPRLESLVEKVSEIVYDEVGQRYP